MKTKSAWFIINDTKGNYLARDVVHGFSPNARFVPSETIEEMEKHWEKELGCEIYITKIFFVDGGDSENGEKS